MASGLSILNSPSIPDPEREPMSAESMPAPGGGMKAPNVSGETARLPIFSRNTTGLVRNVSLVNMVAFNASSTNPLGLGLLYYAFGLVLFPHGNPYIALLIAGVACFFVWLTFALFSAAMPSIGGDYTINTRVLPPWLALSGNVGMFLNGLSGAPIFAYWFVTQAISPVLSVIGTVTHSSTIENWGNDFSAAHHTTVFLVATAAVVLISVLAIRGTRLTMRLLTWSILIATAGLAVDVVILLFTSNASFIATVNSQVGAGAYQQAVAAGASAGLYPVNGYSTSQTWGLVYYAMTVTIWCFWGTYMSAEFRGAGQRRRQVISMCGTGVVQVLTLMGLYWIVTRTIGAHFFISALSGNFAHVGNNAVGSAGYVYFSALVASNKILVTVLAICFLGWFLPSVYINLAMPHRAFLTWGFDGLVPKGLADTNDRTHTPVRSIVLTLILCIPFIAWVSYSANAFQYIALNALFGFVAITFVGVSGMLIAKRRPDLYQGTPAQFKIAGIEVLPVAGILCAATSVLGVYLAVRFHTALGVNLKGVIGSTIGIFLLGGIWWVIARAVRSREGIDLRMSYQALPPD
jgi:amino acid transporter